LKTNLSPKLIQDIDDNAVVLWFEKTNRYVVTSKINSELIKQYMNPDNSRDSLVDTISSEFNLNNNDVNKLLDDITIFLSEVNTEDLDNGSIVNEYSAPSSYIQETYTFGDKIVTIRYESEVVKSLIHPQIAHHASEASKEADILFHIIRNDDTLHLLKNDVHIGAFKTESFHFLQGKFALELTNTIHNTHINNWIATFHASTISNGKQSIMIIGDSGNGKSTLSVLLMAHGFDILCDDFTPLYEDTMHLYRYPAATSIKKGAFDALKPYLKDIDLLKTHTNGPKKVNIKYVPPILNYENQPSCFPCNKIVYVKYNSTGQDQLNLVSSDKVLETLIPDSWISPKEAHASKFIAWFKNVTCYQLNYSNNDFAISKFKNLFKES
jgi:hypothetical protein